MRILILALLFLPTIALAEVPDFPMAFWGQVTIDGNPAPTGAVIRVYDGAEKVGEVTVQAGGVYGYTEPTMQKLLVRESEGALSFTIQATTINSGLETAGLTPVTHPGFVSGETIEKNLLFTLTTVSTSNPSSGGSSGGGGGGGGGKPKPKVTNSVEQVLGVSTTTISESDAKLALQKQLIILLKQLLALLLQQKTQMI